MLTVILVVASFWTCIWILNAVLQVFAESFYQRWVVDAQAISVSFGSVRWQTTRFNRFFERFARRHERWLRYWFDLGLIFGLLAMLAGVYLLTMNLISMVVSPSEPAVLTPVIPGVNLPNAHLAYYFVALAFTGILHEAGHAIAAAGDSVLINSCGVFLMAIYPGAFVDLDGEQLSELSGYKQLRIYCAGVWHNFIVVMAAMGLVLVLPLLLSPLYTTGIGAVVVHVQNNSPLYGTLPEYIRVTGFNHAGCVVNSVADWNTCLLSMAKETSAETMLGRCVGMVHLQTYNATKDPDCCEGITEDADGRSTLCFREQDARDRATFSGCLPARRTLEAYSCRQQEECATGEACVMPVLDLEYQRLFSVDTFPEMKPIYFLGHPLALIKTVRVIDLHPRFALVPFFIPVLLDTVLNYVITLSSALAVLNMVPAFNLDGQWAFTAMLEVPLIQRRLSETSRANLCKCVSRISTVLLATNIILSLAKM